MVRAPNGAPMVERREPHRPTPHDLVRVAARAGVDPKTVRRYLETGKSRSTTRQRIEKGLALCGLADCIRRAG